MMNQRTSKLHRFVAAPLLGSLVVVFSPNVSAQALRPARPPSSTDASDAEPASSDASKEQLVNVPGSDLPYFAAGGKPLEPPFTATPYTPPREGARILAVLNRITRIVPFTSHGSFAIGETLIYSKPGRSKPAAFVLGFAAGAGGIGFSFGGSFFRYHKAPKVFESNGWTGWIPLPTLEPTIGVLYGINSFITGKEGSMLAHFSLTTDLTGFRVQKCWSGLGLVAELRAPRIGLAGAVHGTDSENDIDGFTFGGIAVGGSMSVGLVF